MKFVSQKGNYTKIGNTNYKISRYGCKICSIASVLEVNPNDIAKHAEYFDADALLIDDAKCASDFGGKFNSERSVALHDPVIIDTRYDGSQHFVVRYQGRIYDPLSYDGTPLRDYKVIGYRNFWKETMNGLKLWDNNGQVWAEFDNKQFYVENPKSIEGLSIVKGQPSGEILIKQKDQDVRLAQLRTEMQGQIDARDVQISNLNSKIEQLKKQNSTLVTQNSEYNKEVESIKELFEDCQTQKDDCITQINKLQKQIDEHKCEVKEMTAWEHFKMFISKLIERK